MIWIPTIVALTGPGPMLQYTVTATVPSIVKVIVDSTGRVARVVTNDRAVLSVWVSNDSTKVEYTVNRP